MNVKAIVNGRIVTQYSVIPNGTVIIGDDRILEYGPQEKVTVPEGAEIIDAEGNYVGPGFIDTHCHGGWGCWVHDDPGEVIKCHLEHGTTGFLATMIYTIGIKEMIKGLQKVKDFEGKKYSSAIIGIHMEGPYINPKFGTNSWTASKPDPEEIKKVIEITQGSLKVWTLAPEIEGIDELIETALRENIIISAGHTEVTPERLMELIPKGLRLATHWGCATGIKADPSRFRGTREAGVDEAVLISDEIYAEVIPDSKGHHVRPVMLKLLYKAKGPDKIIIITDATEISGARCIRYIEEDGMEVVPDNADLKLDQNGDLAGTGFTMDNGVRNFMYHTGVGIVEAFRMASLNAAKLLGIDNTVGSIDRGKKANIVIVTDKIDVKKVIFEGELVKG